MAITPTDPTMQIPSPELVRRIESLISSLLGVTESRVDRDESGAIRSLHASVAPGHSPDRVRREIRSALLSSLDLDLAPEAVDVEVEEQRGRRQKKFWEGPGGDQDIGVAGGEAPRSAGTRSSEGPPRPEEARSPKEEARVPEGGPVAEDPAAEPEEETGLPEEDAGHGAEEWLARADAAPGSRKRGPAGDRKSDEGDDRRDEADEVGSASRAGASPRGEVPSGSGDGDPAEVFDRLTPESARGSITSLEEEASAAEIPPQESSGSGGLLPLSLGEYVLLGGGGKDAGVELRIRVEAGDDRFVGTVRVASLEDVSPGVFVGATLRAVERALDARPVSERSARILILEAVDMEEVVLREGRFLAATVQAVFRDGERRATGLVPAEGRVLREAGAEAGLDAVTRILQDRHTTRVEGRGRIRRETGDLSGGSRDRSDRRGSGGGRDTERPAARGGSDARGTVERDPFHVWE